MAQASHQTVKLAESTTLPTVLDHIRELRARLFWIVGAILLTSTIGYALRDQLLSILTYPLGDQQLYYLTPVGGLSFIIKLSFYFGILVSAPLLIYHLFRYLEPLMRQRQHSVVGYMIFSTILAGCGVAFAYFVSLPAALHFLTDFNLNDITAMLTVDAYLSFVTSYVVGAALFFQIPLVLLIINKITPRTPGGLMKYQRHIILAAFIIAAIISPTPDVVNQALLAVPIIVMYQFGVVLVWWQNRLTRSKVPASAVPVAAKGVMSPATVQPFKGAQPTGAAVPPPKAIKPTGTIAKTVPATALAPASQPPLARQPRPHRLVADIQRHPTARARVVPARRPLDLAVRRPNPQLRTQRLASIDGIIT